MKDDFYRYIFKYNTGYRILKNNNDYGSYKDVRDALYDRDLLEQLDWDYEALLNYDVNVDNPYYHMELPPFTHKAKHIATIPPVYRVYVDNVLYASFKDKTHAQEYMDKYGGRLQIKPEKYLLYHYVDGKKKHYGTFYDYEKCIAYRDKLIENDWRL